MQIYMKAGNPEGKSSSDSEESQRFHSGWGTLQQHLFEHELLRVVNFGALNRASLCIFAAFISFAVCGLQQPH